MSAPDPAMIPVDRTTPTRAELVAILETSWEAYQHASDRDWIESMADPLRGDAVWRTDGGDQFGDNAVCHPRLAELVDQAIDEIHARCRTLAIEALADAGARFAAEYPAFARGPDPDPAERWALLEGPPAA